MENWQKATSNQLRERTVSFSPGDQVDVHYRVIEGDKERIQVFSGVVIGRRGGGVGESFTVRKVASGGVGVERIFPLHSPYIDDIQVKRQGRVRRAKLYYLRQRKGKAARVDEKKLVVEKG